MEHPANMRNMTCCWWLLCVILILSSGADGFAQAGRQLPVRVVINEILTSNSRSIRDPQGHYDDWIELYNASPVAVDVGGLHLTDDLSRPTKWQIPTGDPAATTLTARGYLLIWADGDVTDPGLHAGFRLSDEGEDVGLFAADGVTLLDSLSFGPQRVDVSYGRYPNGGAELRFMVIPTPGAGNISMYEGIVETPEADVRSSLCAESVSVTLTTATEEATIHYTLDGGNPFSEARGVPTGSLYAGPIPVSRTTTLKAVAWKPGWRQSDLCMERYVFVGRDVQGFTSPLPIAVIDTMGRGVSTVSTPAYSFFIDIAAESRAAITGAADFAGAAAINIRGKSSSGFPKRQYHLETQDERGDDKDVSILGFPSESDWVLQAMYSDKSLMRNALAYQWSNELGRWAAHTRFIEMFLNTDDSIVTMADYIGVYVFMEKIKISPNRVAITQLEPGDYTQPHITGGYIIKKDKFDGDDQSFGTSRGQSLIYMDPNGRELTQPQKDWIRNYMNSFEAALYGPNFKDPATGYAKFVDVGSFIDHHIVVELCKNIDGFRLSTYMFKDRGGKLNMGPVWDYDLSLGNANYLNGWIPTGWYNSQLGEGDYPYWRRLFEDPEFRLRYADRWFGLRRELFMTDRLLGTIEGYATLLDEPAKRNFDRWRILGVYVWPNWFIARTYREEINWMKGWLSDRLKWMDGQVALEFAPAPPAFNRQGGHVDAGFVLAVSAPGTVYFTLDDSDPRLFTEPVSRTTTVTLAPENAAKRVLVPSQAVSDTWRGGGPFDDSAWTPVTGGPGGIGYERGSNFKPFISLDVRGRMLNLQNSCYVRIPFTCTRSVGNLESMTLGVRYDDGFVAYLNGIEIARRNFAGHPAWNSTADTPHPDLAAVELESIPITYSRTPLRQGSNLLAIHAMNAPVDNLSFLISAELTAEESVRPQTPPQVYLYTGPVALPASARVKARSFHAGRWSAVNEAVFAAGPVAESLRISEIMYHPADTGDPNDPNTEFIELTNIGAEAINLNLVRLTDGVEFTFPSFELPPAGCCLVVRDEPAFERKYGPALPIAGRYSGALSNAGERIVLTDAGGWTIHDFEFSDNWYDATDGAGFSLTLREPSVVDPNALGNAGVWRPSTERGGSPGSVDMPKP